MKLRDWYECIMSFICNYLLAKKFCFLLLQALVIIIKILSRFALSSIDISWSHRASRALLSNGPGGPGPRAPELQGAPSD